MARSTYIYILFDDYCKVKGAFTVKHECVSAIKRLDHPIDLWYVEIWRDNEPHYIPATRNAIEFING